MRTVTVKSRRGGVTATRDAVLAAHGLVVPYQGASTACPACASRSWLVGRSSAECARCGTALPLHQPTKNEPALERID